MTDDLIRRQDAIMVVKDQRLEAIGCIPESYNAGVDASASVLEMIPSAQRWIPCSERLPEVYEAGNSVSGMFMQSRPVLVYGVPEYESEHGFHVVTYCDDLNGITYWSTELDAVTINKVIAWMPLPEPYEVGRNE